MPEQRENVEFLKEEISADVEPKGLNKTHRHLKFKNTTNAYNKENNEYSKKVGDVAGVGKRKALKNLANLPVARSQKKKFKVSVQKNNEADTFIPYRVNTKFPVDEADAVDEFCCASFAFEIYEYLYHREQKFKITEQYLLKQINGRTRVVTPIMRSFLIDWIIQTHRQFHLLQETLYLTVQFIDSYLQVTNIPSSKLQLLGVAALFLASKCEEMFIPDIADIVYMTDGSYTKQEILKMEENLCIVLDFELSRPVPLQFLRRYSKIGWVSEVTHCFAKYLMELSLTELDFVHWKPSYLAACALYVSKISFGDDEWSDALVFHSNYLVSDLKSGAKKIALLVINSEESMWQAAREKFTGFDRCPLSDYIKPALKVLKDHLQSNSPCFN